MRYLLLMICFSFASGSLGQEISGSELLDKAIQYHDPNDNWHSFKSDFTVIMESPKGDKRISQLNIDLPASTFKLTTDKDGKTIEQGMVRDSCILKIDGIAIISEKDRASHNISCERAKKMRDYYTYLYGLPMKLKDPGTLVDPIVETKTFKDKEYLTLKITYSEEVGRDTWYFYFDPSSYAMEAYQFFHDESKNDGEYIVLSGEEMINNVKMPKVRAWYYNKNDQYLGTDILSKTPQ
ncbi:DUF6503 family protein [Arenibacter echinorum]|uniref:Uncharacterized protein n=1 Tax=Arenibacter echinorum TaxID=440515 RepID=A0A327RFK0_9FLAO|nr:DUF6503 family protein [Arenibacter echinorum]RAJ14324.1 hypothetical protein LV92_01445 [Arenibacter echinorum]